MMAMNLFRISANRSRLCLSPQDVQLSEQAFAEIYTFSRRSCHASVGESGGRFVSLPVLLCP